MQCELFAGAAKCDTTKGEEVGRITVDAVGGLLSVNLLDGWTFADLHVFVGDEPLPRGNNGRFTQAPGQFPYTYEYDPAINDALVDIDALAEGLFLIVHLSICPEPTEPSSAPTIAPQSTTKPSSLPSDLPSVEPTDFDPNLDDPDTAEPSAAPTELVCETSFVACDPLHFCFLDDQLMDFNGDGQSDFNRWGWSNFVEDVGVVDTFTCDIVAAAPDCDLGVGIVVGTFTLDYTTNLVTWNVTDPSWGKPRAVMRLGCCVVLSLAHFPLVP